MPIDAAGEIIAAALEAVGDVVLSEPPKRGRWRRAAYWLFVVFTISLLAFGAYLAFR